MEGKVYLGSTTEVPSLGEQIRQLVKEEVTAQLSQMQAQSITIDPVEVGETVSRYINENMKPSQTWPLRTWGEADSQNQTWESAKDTTWNGGSLQIDREIPNLKILGDEVFINKRMIPYVTGYELKHLDVASGLAELTLKVAVRVSDMVIDTGTNYSNSDLSKSIQGE